MSDTLLMTPRQTVDLFGFLATLERPYLRQAEPQTDAEEERRQAEARDSLSAFATRMYRHYESSHHIRLLVAELEWAARTPDARLIVTMPPRHSKSLHVSEHLPAWYLGNHPDRRVIGASHTADLAYTFSRRVRNKLEHPSWPFPRLRLAGDKSAVKAWDIAGHYGGYYAVGRGGAPAGHGGDLLVIDDPFKNAADAASQTSRDAVWEWYRESLRTRIEPGGSIVLTATRWHDDDLTGRILEAEKGGGEPWRHLHMPAISDAGSALWPERWPVEALRKIQAAVGEHAWQAQYQGAPSVPEGNIFKSRWWRFWQRAGDELPPVRVKIGDSAYHEADQFILPKNLDQQIQSWDMAFKDTKSGSFVVGQVWGKSGADVFLLDQVRDQMAFPDTVDAVRVLSRSWPKTHEKYVEDKANGPAVIATLQHEVPGLLPVTPEGGKEARANAVTWMVNAGNVYLPHPSYAPWVWDLIGEASNFPNGKHDDQVDALSQALVHLSGSIGWEDVDDGGDIYDFLRQAGVA